MRPRLLLFLALLPLAATAEVYQWKDAQGRTHFSDKNVGQSNAKVVEIKVNSYRHVSYSTVFPPAAATPQQVRLYGTAWCGYCKNARKHLQEKGIDFVDLDIEKNAQAKLEFEAMGGQGVPVIVVGNRRMNGFSVENFQRFYRQPK